MKLSSTTIRFRLLVLICFALLPVVLFSLYAANDRQRDELEHARNDITQLSRFVAAAHERILAQSRQMLAGLVIGNDGPDAPLLGPDCGVHLQRIVSIFPLYRQVAVANADGTVFCTALPLNEPVSLRGRQLFQDILASKAASHSSVITSDLSDIPGIVLGEPIKNENEEIIAVVVAVLNLDWIEDRSEDAALPEGSRVVLVDSDGIVLGAFQAAGAENGAISAAGSFTEAIRHSEQGFTPPLHQDGQDWLRAFVRLPALPGAGVYLVIDFPQSAVTQPAILSFRRMLAGLLLTLAVALLGGWMGVNRFVVNPLRILTRAADRLGKGDLTARTGMTYETNEIGHLANKFDELASHVQRTTRALKSLSAGNRLIVREKDEMHLLQSMCSIAVEIGGYTVAVVNYLQDDATRGLRSMAMAGDDFGFTSIAIKSFAASGGQNSTVGRVLSSGERFVIKSIALDTFGEGWREAALERGFRSVASFPLKTDGRLIGVFTLMSSLEGALDEEELELLDEMAEDLSFGIASIRARQKLDEAELIARRVSTHDLLTDLPLAAPFIELAAQYLAHARRAEEPLAVVVAHIAHMQEVFDNLGYEPGHVIIKEIARRLRGVAELDGVLARLNLEDFGILVRGDAFAAQTIADRVVAQCTLPIKLSDAQFHPQIAMGVCYFPGQGDKPEVLVRRATIAAREAAHRGISLLSCQGSIRQENSQWLTIAGELREALEQKALTLHYQGKFDLVSGERVGAEGLIRWFHPSKGPMSPAQFVPIAEQMGLIRELTFFVAEVAMRQLHDWMKKDIYLPIAVNLSVRNLYDAKLLERIEGLLVTWGIPPELLEFEITESALMEEPEVARAATARLRGNGSKIYIDDFGTGYSSLSYLVSLPVHAVKIDRAFVVQMTKSSQARAVVASIISMAHQLGLKVVAEGVESAEEMAELRNMGCDNVQGYFTGRPMSATDFLAAPSNPLAARNELHKPAE